MARARGKIGSLRRGRAAAAVGHSTAAALFAPKPFQKLPANHFGLILADIPSRFKTWSEKGKGRSAERHYATMSDADILALPVAALAADDCVLLFWATWPKLPFCLKALGAWGFKYKGSAFDWMKADNRQIDFFDSELDADIKMGYWTRQNTEPCLLATRGKPKRLHADVRQGIIEPAREHSRKPDCVYERAERLVAGPYLELFARGQRPGWTAWGNETKRFKAKKIIFDTDNG